jgi:FKBP-type peptidyl-prolyl cis-trans isomerase (trigger factor)
VIFSKILTVRVFILVISHEEILWLKMGDEEVDNALRSIFIDKKVGDIFCVANNELQYFFTQELNASYIFCIKILDIINQSYFCFEHLKKHFKLKTNKEMHQKLIEVFSYRNNMSQRRSTAEESLKLLLNKHRFIIPNHLILRQQEHVLSAVQHNPDYHVYRVQKDFKERIRQLAERQLKERIILDHVAYTDNLSINAISIY